MRILFVGTSGSDDPTRAAFPMVFAKGALEAGHQAMIHLVGEATYLLKDEVAAVTQGVGWPTMSSLWNDIVAAKVPVYV
jgi:predicted peroxiredoxin